MFCAHLILFRLSHGDLPLYSCTANDRAYVPSILELKRHCNSGGHRDCPVHTCAAGRAS